MPNYEKEISEITLFIGTVDGKPKTVSLSDYPTVVAQLSALLRRVEVEGRIKEHIYRKIPHEHNYTIDLGDPCFCGSDNCAMCEFCGDENHD